MNNKPRMRLSVSGHPYQTTTHYPPTPPAVVLTWIAVLLGGIGVLALLLPAWTILPFTGVILLGALLMDGRVQYKYSNFETWDIVEAWFAILLSTIYVTCAALLVGLFASYLLQLPDLLWTPGISTTGLFLGYCYSAGSRRAYAIWQQAQQQPLVTTHTCCSVCGSPFQVDDHRLCYDCLDNSMRWLFEEPHSKPRRYSITLTFGEEQEK